MSELIVKLIIPAIPGSVNHLYGHTRYGLKYLTKKGREFKETVHKAIDEQIVSIPEEFFLGKLGMNVVVYFNDKRKRDLDNCMKILLDSMQHKLFNDDNQIDRFCISRAASDVSGYTEIILWQM